MHSGAQNIRRYRTTDQQRIVKLWQEIGWIEQGEERQELACKNFLKAGPAWVGTINKIPETFVGTTMGSIHHMKAELSFCAVSAVMSGLRSRRQGMGLRVTARALQAAYEKGSEVAGLSIFDQGYYDKLGFATGAPVSLIRFDPSSLNIPILHEKDALPVVLTADKWKEIHASRLGRMHGHGSCDLFSALHTRGELLFEKESLGMGFFNEQNQLTHHFWGQVKYERSHLTIWWMVYQNYTQFLELLDLLQSLGDQFCRITVNEMPGICIQDFLSRPFRQQQVTKDGRYSLINEMGSYNQLRILRLEECLQKTVIPGRGTVRFNLTISDPLEKYLEKGWKGVAGEYVVQLGEESSASSGHEQGLPLMIASVGAFTQLWMGSRRAAALAFQGALQAPEALIKELDWLLLLPPALHDWSF